MNLLKEKSVSKIIGKALSEGRIFLYEHEGNEIISHYGAPTARSIFAETESDVVSAAEEIGYPVVLKVVSPQILHKSDVGGVFLNLKNEKEVKEGFNKIVENVRSTSPNAEILGMIVQQMAPPSTEMIIGSMKDPQFGPVVMFGIGGILTEIIEDVSFKIAPLTQSDVENMMDEIESKAILEGTRGMPKADLPAIADILMTVSEIMTSHPEIEAIDLNPVIVYEEGAIIVDARFILGEKEETEMGALLAGDELRALLEPSSVAVVGASTNVDKIGYKILKNIVDAGFEGNIYPVNPRGGKILGLSAYPSVLDVPGEIEAVVVVVPARFVASVIKECVQKKVKSAIIISSGFRDVGPEGAALEKQMLEIATKGGLRIIGPNCQGICNPQIGFCATWPLISDVGDVAVISQSGSIALEVPSYLSRNQLGYSKTIALGNKSDVDEADLISFLAEDEHTKVITLYTEGMKEGRKLMDAVKKATREKPVLVLKGGKSEAGKKAVLAHTGSLAGSNKVFEAAVKQSGGLCVKNLEELCDVAKAFSMMPVPRGNRLAVITSSGGAGILSSDACEDAGLVLSNLSGPTLKKLREGIPDYCVIGNPLDLTGNALNNAHLYGDALEVVLEDDSVDMVLVVYGDPIPHSFEAIEKQVEKARSLGIPVAVNYLGGGEVQEIETVSLQKNGLPVFETPSRAVVALSYMHRYREYVSETKGA